MKSYFSSFLVVMLCYGLGLYSPAASAKAQAVDYDAVRKYVNSKEKKSIKQMFVKFGDSLPTKMVEEALKMSKGKEASTAWFDGVKMGPNYVYMRIGKVKLFARAATDKSGQKYIMLNKTKITLDDYRDIKTVQAKIFMAYMNEALSKKGIFSYLFASEVFAGGGENIGNGSGKPLEPGAVTPIDACVEAQKVFMAEIGKPPKTAQEKQQCKKALDDAKTACCHQEQYKDGEVCKRNACDDELVGAAASGGNGWMWLLGIGAAALLLFLLLKKDKKDEPGKPPVEPPPTDDPPEDDDGVGRGPILCQGAEANCGGGGTYPDPPSYDSPSSSSGSSSSEPYPDTGSNSNLGNSDNETATGVGREKSRARVKTK